MQKKDYSKIFPGLTILMDNIADIRQQRQANKNGTGGPVLFICRHALFLLQAFQAGQYRFPPEKADNRIN